MENINCLRCRFRHEDNGNCTAVGGSGCALPATAGIFEYRADA